MADREQRVPVGPKTRFHLASVSKPFTAAAILLLEQQGKLRTSDALARWLPGFPRGEQITLRDLLTHTSGIPDINGAPFYAAASREPQTAASLVERIRGIAPASAPRGRYEYSNSNYNLLAYVIERASGQSYGEFLEQALFAPLGMRDTGHHGDASALIPDRAAGYTPAGLRDVAHAPYLDWSVKTGNGSLYSTADDLLKFDQALYGERLLPKGSVERILGAGSGNVYGWGVGERSGRRRMAASGRSPGFTASFERYVDDRVTVIVLANVYSTASFAIAGDLAALALGQPVPPASDLTPIAVPSAELAKLAGTYVGGDDFFFPGTQLTVTSRDGHLNMHWSTGADSILVPVGERTFLDRSFWARVRFEQNRLVWIYDGRAYPAAREP
jgi:CubicO group peptidase (beta-lactamase class C family)